MLPLVLFPFFFLLCSSSVVDASELLRDVMRLCCIIVRVGVPVPSVYSSQIWSFSNVTYDLFDNCSSLERLFPLMELCAKSDADSLFLPGLSQNLLWLGVRVALRVLMVCSKSKGIISSGGLPPLTTWEDHCLPWRICKYPFAAKRFTADR